MWVKSVKFWSCHIGLNSPSLFGEGRGSLFLEIFTPFIPLKGELVEKDEDGGKYVG